MSVSGEAIHFAIGRAEALVLFEMLAHFHAQPCLQIDGTAERLALIRLQGALEHALIEPLCRSTGHWSTRPGRIYPLSLAAKSMIEH